MAKYEVVVIAPDNGAVLVFGRYAEYWQAEDRATELAFAYPTVEIVPTED